MSPEPARPLYDEIGGGKISHHQVKIEIEALLDHLRRHQHAPRPLFRATIATKPFQDLPLDVLAVAHRKPGMEHRGVDARLSQFLSGFDRIIDGISHPGHGCTRSRRSDNRRDSARWIGKSLYLNPPRQTWRHRASFGGTPAREMPLSADIRLRFIGLGASTKPTRNAD